MVYFYKTLSTCSDAVKCPDEAECRKCHFGACEQAEFMASKAVGDGE